MKTPRAYHLYGPLSPDEILEEGSTRFILSSNEREGEDGEIEHHMIVIADQDDKFPKGNSCNRVREYRRGKGRSSNSIYWKGTLYDKEIKKWVRLMCPKGNARFTNNDGYGFVSLPKETRSIECLVGVLNYIRDKEDGTFYDFAREKKQRETPSFAN